MPALTPKRDFQEDTKAVGLLADLTDAKPFRDAAKAALLQMLESLDDADDPVKASAAFHRMMGARNFMRSLLTLADQPKQPDSSPVRDNLNHRT